MLSLAKGNRRRETKKSLQINYRITYRLQKEYFSKYSQEACVLYCILLFQHDYVKTGKYFNSAGYRYLGQIAINLSYVYLQPQIQAGIFFYRELKRIVWLQSYSFSGIDFSIASNKPLFGCVQTFIKRPQTDIAFFTDAHTAFSYGLVPLPFVLIVRASSLPVCKIWKTANS